MSLFESIKNRLKYDLIIEKNNTGDYVSQDPSDDDPWKETKKDRLRNKRRAQYLKSLEPSDFGKNPDKYTVKVGKNIVQTKIVPKPFTGTTGKQGELFGGKTFDAKGKTASERQKKFARDVEIRRLRKKDIKTKAEFEKLVKLRRQQRGTSKAERKPGGTGTKTGSLSKGNLKFSGDDAYKKLKTKQGQGYVPPSPFKDSDFVSPGDRRPGMDAKPNRSPKGSSIIQYKKDLKFAGDENIRPPSRNIKTSTLPTTTARLKKPIDIVGKREVKGTIKDKSGRVKEILRKNMTLKKGKIDRVRFTGPKAQGRALGKIAAKRDVENAKRFKDMFKTSLKRQLGTQKALNIKSAGGPYVPDITITKSGKKASRMVRKPKFDPVDYKPTPKVNIPKDTGSLKDVPKVTQQLTDFDKKLKTEKQTQKKIADALKKAKKNQSKQQGYSFRNKPTPGSEPIVFRKPPESDGFRGTYNRSGESASFKKSKITGDYDKFSAYKNLKKGATKFGKEIDTLAGRTRFDARNAKRLNKLRYKGLGGKTRPVLPRIAKSVGKAMIKNPRKTLGVGLLAYGAYEGGKYLLNRRGDLTKDDFTSSTIKNKSGKDVTFKYPTYSDTKAREDLKKKDPNVKLDPNKNYTDGTYNPKLMRGGQGFLSGKPNTKQKPLLSKFKSGEFKVFDKNKVGKNNEININDRLKNSAFEKQMQKAEKGSGFGKIPFRKNFLKKYQTRQDKKFLKTFKNAARPT